MPLYVESASPPLSTMDESTAVKALAALAQVQRLRAFRALVAAGPQGLTPGVMAASLGIAPSALSFHLKELVHAGMAHSQTHGRFLIYRAEFAQMAALLAFLTAHCCEGQGCEASGQPAQTVTVCV